MSRALNPRRRVRVLTVVARSRRVVLIATAAALAVGAAPARADSILYRCFPNLCRVAPGAPAGRS